MGRFTSESLELLKERVDLADLLSSHIEMKKAGASYKALCPFHDERTPSFMIQTGDTHYHCFGCGAHGDAIEFLMSYLKMSFIEAVEHLGERYGVQLERTEERNGPDRGRLKGALKAAADYYHKELLASKEPLAYLHKRGLDDSFIERFQIGFAPSPGQLISHLHKAEFDNGTLETVGLIKNGREFFRERILFPICNGSGSIIGFSGRKFLEETFGGKYVNTPDTPLFHKSKILFGFHHSRRRMAKEKRALIVEGQIDALRLIHAGLDKTVAGQGTAFGEPQVEELASLGIREVHLAMDGDNAGRIAALKIGNLFLKQGIGVKVVPLPDGQDPDTILSKGGLDAFLALLDQSIDYLSFAVKIAETKIDTSTPAGKADLVRRLSNQIREWSDPVLIHESLRQLAELTSLPQETIGYQASPNLHIRRSSTIGQVSIDPDQVVESDTLRWLFLLGEHDPYFLSLAQENLAPDDFIHPLCRALFEAYTQDAPRDLLSLAARIPDEAQDLLSSILEGKVNKEKAKDQFPQSIQKILERNWMTRREEVKQQMAGGNDDEVLLLAKEFDRLRQNPPRVICPDT